MTNRHTLAVLVENKPGVLTRVAALFARRAFNIKSLTVGETEHPEISRMTIIVDADSAPIEQVVKQLNKLINVLKVVELEPEDSVERRLLMMKVQADETKQPATQSRIGNGEHALTFAYDHFVLLRTNQRLIGCRHRQ